ncbi:hypothetical protein HETIRDRAFT_312374 [Heterobasidion irregulare TC 32-1]|uniref:DNA 3'-5' helicase n=1 Tax=Heterobasidion irregulare (strain TC 32-1) TaxID=747525 RepID=W4KGE3_HETIT|nr:uncharacterized protein HETIRDRAFT_312374 [Heterobasidion irregulare TC 32-1]ETW84933.1 hypothetical protein HETIRDRAFT_312374 [Heterobasidion irregulare TC 32-1]
MNGWTSPEGILYIKETLCTLLPWPNSPHNWQVNSTANILEENNQLVIVACGEGKTAVAYLHHILISHLSKKPLRSLPPFVRSIRSTTVVLMITPLIDVGLCQVEEMSRMGVRVVLLDKETVREAHQKGKNLLKEVEQGKWSVIIVSPERLNSPEFERIVQNEWFRKLLALYVINEAHVVLPWAADFCEAYGQINHFIVRIPVGIPVLAMSRTLGSEAKTSLTKFLGFCDGTYQTIQRSCE